MLIMLAGIVSTYFQFASHSMCMKNRMTSIAFVHETAIIKAHIACGEFCRSVSLLPTANETKRQPEEGNENGDVFADAGVAVFLVRGRRFIAVTGIARVEGMMFSHRSCRLSVVSGQLVCPARFADN